MKYGSIAVLALSLAVLLSYYSTEDAHGYNPPPQLQFHTNEKDYGQGHSSTDVVRI